MLKVNNIFFIGEFLNFHATEKYATLWNTIINEANIQPIFFGHA